MRVKVEDKVIPASFLTVEGRRTLVWAKTGELDELVGGQNPGPEAPSRSKKGQERSKGDVRRATASGAM